MKIVLTQDVSQVGRAGEVREVADGYARNYLLPHGMAVAATAGVLKHLSAQQKVETQRHAKTEQEARAMAEQIEQTQLVFQVRVGEQYRLYGAITTADIAESLSQRLGRPVDKRKVQLSEPIKHLGTYQVPIRLRKDIVPQVAVVVEREEVSEQPAQ